MKARIVKIGNSQGIRIPKPLLAQTGIGEDVELDIDKDRIIIRPASNPRSGWEEAFQAMAEAEDDRMIGEADSIQSSWDDEEWQW